MARSFMLIYNKAIRAKYVGMIMSAVERTGIRLAGLNLRYVSDAFLTQHIDNSDAEYKEHHELAASRNSGAVVNAPFVGVVAILWEGDDVVSQVRNIFPVDGDIATWPVEQDGVTISVDWDMIYTSDSVKSAERDINLWFDSDRMNDPINYRSWERGDYDADDSEINVFSCPIEKMVIVLIKSYAVERGLVGEIVNVLENKNFNLKGLKYIPGQPSQDGAVEARVAMIWHGNDIIFHIQQTMAATEKDVYASWISNGKSHVKLGSEHIDYFDSAPTEDEVKQWFIIDEVLLWREYLVEVLE